MDLDFATGRFPNEGARPYAPIKATAWLQCGVISDSALPIDAILYYQAHRDAYGAQVLTLSGDTGGGANHAPMLIQRVGLPYQGFRYADGMSLAAGVERIVRTRETAWYYAASFAQWSDNVEGIDHWNKRFDASLADLVDFGGKRGRVIVEAGAYKAYHMPVFYRVTRTITWYLVGDIDWVREMLSTATHIGKKPAQGWGQVHRWDVQPWHADWSVYGAHGQLMRAIPAEHGILTGIRPSYWVRRNQVICEVPQ